MSNKGIKDSVFRLLRAKIDEADVSVDDVEFAGLDGEFWASSKYLISWMLLGSP